MATNPRATAERAIRYAQLALRASDSNDYERYEEYRSKAVALVNDLDNHRMRTNSAAAHREWERAYSELERVEASYESQA